jgi:hypothetical protein
MQLAGTAGNVNLSRVMCHRTIRRDAAEAARRVCVTLVDPVGSVARPDEWETNMPTGPERLTVLDSAAPAYMATSITELERRRESDLVHVIADWAPARIPTSWRSGVQEPRGQEAVELGGKRGGPGIAAGGVGG